jgi:hypothetical protein
VTALLPRPRGTPDRIFGKGVRLRALKARKNGLDRFTPGTGALPDAAA